MSDQLPLRIQRRRTKGWKMPPNTAYVGRQSLWGNPFVVGVHGDRERCMTLYVALFYGFLNIAVERDCIEAQRRVMYQIQHGLGRLAGKQLCCWCPPDALCHADVLLHLANKVQLPAAWLPRFQPIG